MLLMKASIYYSTDKEGPKGVINDVKRPRKCVYSSGVFSVIRGG